jgi:hypothetical protein
MEADVSDLVPTAEEQAIIRKLEASRSWRATWTPDTWSRS